MSLCSCALGPPELCPSHRAKAEADAIAASIAEVDPEPEPPTPVDPPENAWLRRRTHAFGASEIAAVMIALGKRNAEDFPDFVKANGHRIRVRGGRAIGRLFLQKAGLRIPLKIGDHVRLGAEREPELIRQWEWKVRKGTAGISGAIVPDTIRHSVAAPREWYPLVDRHCPRVAVTPDAWARDIFGELVMIEAKCSFRAYHDKYRGMGPHHYLQLQAQMAACDATYGLAVEGQRWSNAHFDAGDIPTGAIVTWECERDEAVIREIREAAEEGWAIVESLRAEFGQEEAA